VCHSRSSKRRRHDGPSIEDSIVDRASAASPQLPEQTAIREEGFADSFQTYLDQSLVEQLDDFFPLHDLGAPSLPAEEPSAVPNDAAILSMSPAEMDKDTSPVTPSRRTQSLTLSPTTAHQDRKRKRRSATADEISEMGEPSSEWDLWKEIEEQQRAERQQQEELQKQPADTPMSGTKGVPETPDSVEDTVSGALEPVGEQTTLPTFPEQDIGSEFDQPTAPTSYSNTDTTQFVGIDETHPTFFVSPPAHHVEEPPAEQSGSHNDFDIQAQPARFDPSYSSSIPFSDVSDQSFGHIGGKLTDSNPDIYQNGNYSTEAVVRTAEPIYLFNPNNSIPVDFSMTSVDMPLPSLAVTQPTMMQPIFYPNDTSGYLPDEAQMMQHPQIFGADRTTNTNTFFTSPHIGMIQEEPLEIDPGQRSGHTPEGFSGPSDYGGSFSSTMGHTITTPATDVSGRTSQRTSPGQQESGGMFACEFCEETFDKAHKKK
jgi:hypothetical protein